MEVSLIIVIAVLDFLGGLTDGHPSVKQKPRLSKHPVVLVVSFDGFRPDYMKQTETPNLRTFQEEGVSVPYMQPSFPTKTFPNHISIATGLYPDYHGVVDNSVFDPVFGRRFGARDNEFWNYRPDVLPFWIRNELAGDERFSGGILWASSNFGYGENKNLFPTHYTGYVRNMTWETRVETAISWITNATHPANIVFLYYGEPDSTGHEYGVEDARTLAEVRNCDLKVGHLVNELKVAGIYDDINVLIVSDHGMSTITAERTVNTTTVSDRDLYDIFGNGSPIYHIRPKSSVDTDRIYNAFSADSATKPYSVYRKQDLGFLNYGTNRRIGDIVLVADEGHAFEDVLGWDQMVDGVMGLHGYDNRLPSMDAMFMARGSLFKTNYLSSTIIKNVDLFPLFSYMAGIAAAPNNGSLSATSHLLKLMD